MTDSRYKFGKLFTLDVNSYTTGATGMANSRCQEYGPTLRYNDKPFTGPVVGFCAMSSTKINCKKAPLAVQCWFFSRVWTYMIRSSHIQGRHIYKVVTHIQEADKVIDLPTKEGDNYPHG